MSNKKLDAIADAVDCMLQDAKRLSARAGALGKRADAGMGKVSYAEAQKHPAWQKLTKAGDALRELAKKLDVYDKRGNYRKLPPADQATWDRAYAEYNKLRNEVHKETGYTS